jgi:hypothetical protein
MRIPLKRRAAKRVAAAGIFRFLGLRRFARDVLAAVIAVPV